MQIENRCVEIKDTLQKLTDVKCSSTARLVAVLIACGIESTTEIAKLIGKSDRMVRSARKELSAPGNILPEADCHRKQVAGNRLPEAEADCRPRVHAPAQKELPSGVYPSQEVASSACEVEEIPGLNGSTFRYVDMLAGWLAGDLRPKEPDVAQAILAGNVEHYGADQVKAGMLELQAAIGAGQRPRDPGKAFSGFVKNAKPPRAGEAPKLSKIDDRVARARALMSPEGRAAAEANDRRLAS